MSRYDDYNEDPDEAERESDRLFFLLDYVYGEEDGSGARISETREVCGSTTCDWAYESRYIDKAGGIYITTSEGRRIWGKLMGEGRGR